MTPAERQAIRERAELALAAYPESFASQRCRDVLALDAALTDVENTLGKDVDTVVIAGWILERKKLEIALAEAERKLALVRSRSALDVVAENMEAQNRANRAEEALANLRTSIKYCAECACGYEWQPGWGSLCGGCKRAEVALLERDNAEDRASGLKIAADRAVRERDALGNQLAQEKSKPGGSFDQWARLQSAEEAAAKLDHVIRIALTPIAPCPNRDLSWHNTLGCEHCGHPGGRSHEVRT
jgi:hypothetical protein